MIDVCSFVKLAGINTIPEHNLWLLIVLASVLLVCLGVFWLIRFKRKRSAQRLELAKSLGFEPVDEPTPAVLEGIARLYRSNQEQELDLRNVFVQHRTDAVFYIMDILDTGGDETPNLGEDVIVILSPYLAVPRFVMIPMMNLEGRLGGLINQALDEVIDMIGPRQGLIRVPFDQDPEIDDHFIIFAADPDKLREFFTASYMSGFFNIPPKYEIMAGGDMLIIKAIIPEQGKNREEVLREQYQDAEAVYRLLSQ